MQASTPSWSIAVLTFSQTAPFIIYEWIRKLSSMKKYIYNDQFLIRKSTLLCRIRKNIKSDTIGFKYYNKKNIWSQNCDFRDQ